MITNKVLLKYAQSLKDHGDGRDLPVLLITVGIPGSGKSTWIRSQKGFEVVSLDEIRKQLTGSITNQNKEKEVVDIGRNKIKQLLSAGKNVIYDATNVKYWFRQNMLKDMPPHIKKAKIFHVDPEEAKKRIRQDIENKVDRSNVPPEKIDELYKHFTNTISRHELENEGFEII